MLCPSSIDRDHPPTTTTTTTATYPIHLSTHGTHKTPSLPSPPPKNSPTSQHLPLPPKHPLPLPSLPILAQPLSPPPLPQLAPPHQQIPIQHTPSPRSSIPPPFARRYRIDRVIRSGAEGARIKGARGIESRSEERGEIAEAAVGIFC